MKKWKYITSFVVALGLSVGLVSAQPVITPPTFATHVFTPLHLFYMSPTGSDAANGLTPATAWATPNHNLVCGDVIIAASGTYNGDFSTWGTVSSCPSTSGGVDGTGGIQAAVLLCGGTDLGANGCKINCATGACNTGAGDGTHGNAVKAVMQLNKNNWSIQGWQGNGNGTTGRGFQMDTCLSSTQIVHHVSVINSIIINANQGLGATGCLHDGTAVPGNGFDYTAWVGVIVENAAQDSICLGAVDIVGPANFDTNSGTHMYIKDTFVSSSFATPCITISDAEGILLDTLDGHAYSGQIVIDNNAAWNTMRNCIQVFYQNYHNTTPIINIHNNSCYNNLTNVGNDGGGAEINTNNSNQGGLNIGIPWTTTIQKNIARNTHDLSDSTTKHIVALVSGGNPASTAMTIGGTGTENVFLSSSTVALGTCDSTKSACEFNSNSFGTNIYVNPNYANESDLNTNWLGAPDCTGFPSTTRCMGYNPLTSTLTPNTPIADLQASCTGCSGKGYQLPTTVCNTNAEFPAYLKNLVRLSWNSSNSTITQVYDLSTVKCGS